MGRLDPCWAILSSPEKRFGQWDWKTFLATGDEEIGCLMADAARFELPKLRGRALDFGCGVGRLTKALSNYFDEAVGLDISAAMVAHARQLCHGTNCRFIVSAQPRLPFGDAEFDLIYSTIVLQHVPEKRLIKQYIAEFVRVLRPSGLLVMQVPSHIRVRNRLQLKRRLYSWLRSVGVPEAIVYNKLRLHPILMNFVPQDEVCRVVTAADGHVLEITPDQRPGTHIASRTYFATKFVRSKFSAAP